VDLFRYEEISITTIPAGKDKIFIDLSANADLDTKIVAADGTVLLEYVLQDRAWVGGCVVCEDSTTFAYHGMNFETCVDRCTAHKELTYRDGTVFNLEGSGEYAEEWVHIDHTTEDLNVTVVSYQAGTGLIEWLWDCPVDCDTCDPNEPVPAPAPTKAPVPAPTKAPVEGPEQSNDDDGGGGGPGPGACFHADSTVMFESGETKKLSELTVGDRIKTGNDKGNFSFSEVLVLPHAKNTEPAAFLTLITETRKSVDMTSDHFIPTCDYEVVTAGELVVGDCLLTVDGKETLVEIAQTAKYGVYTAVTSEKFIVVNNVVASSHSRSSDSEHPDKQLEKYRLELAREQERSLSYFKFKAGKTAKALRGDGTTHAMRPEAHPLTSF
jgi:hypothetical protein